MAIVDYKAEIRDRTTGALSVTLTKLSMARWVYSRLGGHFSAVIETPQTFTAADVAKHWDLQILVDSGAGFTVRWRGFIVSAGRRRGYPDIYFIGAIGYQFRLERISIVGLGFSQKDGGTFFERKEPAALSKELLDKAKKLIAWPTITWDSTSAPATSIGLKRIEFNNSIAKAIAELAQIAGMREWALVHDSTSGYLVFHFRPPSTVTRFTATHGGTAGDVVSLDEEYFSQEIANRIYLMGRRFNAIIENTDDLAVDQSNLADNEDFSFGKSTTFQKVIQRFDPAYPTLYQIKLKLGKSGWPTNLATDGDMEAAGTANYTAGNALTSLSKDAATTPHAGTQSLKSEPNDPFNTYLFGWYRNIAVTAGTSYKIGIWVQTSLNAVLVEMVDGSGSFGNTNPILSYDSTDSSSWVFFSFNVTPTGTTLGIRLSAENTGEGTEEPPDPGFGGGI